MKLETFFEKFELFADAPNAVAKMRELILDLAIGGKLLPSFRKYGQAVVCDWPNQPLGSIASLITKGSTPTSYGHQYETSGIPFVKVENIKDGVIQRSSAAQFISEVTHEFLKRSQLEAGDILFSIAGTIGKTCIVTSEDVPANTNQALAIIRGVDTSFEISFLKMQLDSFVANKVKEKARGGAMPNVSLGDLQDLQVVVPPLAEQKRIVAKVDELMALCDRLETQQQERDTRHAVLARASLSRFADAATPENLNLLFHPSYAIAPADLRKTILTLAVQGKLVPQDTNDEPALALIERITAHKGKSLMTGKQRNEARVVPMAAEEGSYELPRNWVWVHFGEIMISRDSERIPISKDERSNRAKIYDYYGASGVIDKIDGYLFDKPLLLIGEDGANLINRSTPIAFMARGKYWVNNHAHVLDGISEEFLLYIELHINAINLEPYVTGTAQPKMNQAKMNSIPIALPPLAEQIRIVAKVDELMALVDRLETQLAASCAAAVNLMEAVVAELTVQG